MRSFVREIQVRAQYLRAALVAVAFADVFELFADDLLLLLLGGEDGQQLLDFLEDLVVLVDEAALLQRRQAAQVHVQDGLRLFFGEVVEAVFVNAELVAQFLRPAGVDVRARQEAPARSRTSSLWPSAPCGRLPAWRMR